MARGRPKQPREKRAKFWKAPEVETIARELIDEHHRHLQGKLIRFVFRGKAAPAKGQKVKWGSAEIVSGLKASLAMGLPAVQVEMPTEERFFLVQIAWPIWINLKPEQKTALVDHELCHCGVNDKGDLCLWPHDLEEFRVIVKRHGMWQVDVKEFAAAIQQALPLESQAPAESNQSDRSSNVRAAA